MSTIINEDQDMSIVIAGHVDHGKSTVIGRLLADAGALPQGKLEQIRELCRRTSKPFEYAFLLDALRDERAQGITIDMARCFFKTALRRYLIIDAPGHIEFLKNMVTGASHAEAALLVIDAAEGVRENSRRHGYMLSMLGIRQIDVLVNKMDLVDYDRAVFERIVSEYGEYLAQIGVVPRHFIPVSAAQGDCITALRANMPWYAGLTVLQALDAFEQAPPPDGKPLRLPVQDVYKFTSQHDDRRIVAGTIETGTLRAGDELVFLPSGKRTRVHTLEEFNRPTPERFTSGCACGFTMEQQIYIERGELACRAGEPLPHVGSRFCASVFWLGREPLSPGRDYTIKLGTARSHARLAKVTGTLDASTLQTQQKDYVAQNEVAQCVFILENSVAFDLAEEGQECSRFVIVDGCEIAGGGIITAEADAEEFKAAPLKWDVDLAPGGGAKNGRFAGTVGDFLLSAGSLVPSPRQLAWYDTEFYAFVHFSPNTFTDLEWGLGSEDPAVFNPAKLDCDQWVEAIKSAGMRGMVLTAKHHDGFCLWPSAYTEHSIKNSPYKSGRGDIVREAAEACRRGGIKFGFYLSPWDRNSTLYGTDAYNDYFAAQLTELLTGYGEIFYVWFDLACGEGPGGRAQKYDFRRWIELIRKYQPNACIFNDHGPDVRWCGNEAGHSNPEEWAVVPREICYYAQTQTGSGPLAPFEAADRYLTNTDPDVGTLKTLLDSEGLVFCPAEVNMSIREGWFWHQIEDPHPLERLRRTYLDSVGNNACFHLNIPPDRDGLFDSRDVTRLRELGEWIRATFSDEKRIASRTVAVASMPDGRCALDIELDGPHDLRYVVLREDIVRGQRVEAFRLLAADSRGEFDDPVHNMVFTCYSGATVGNRKICPVNVNTSKLRLIVSAARGEINWREIAVYGA